MYERGSSSPCWFVWWDPLGSRGCWSLAATEGCPATGSARSPSVLLPPCVSPAPAEKEAAARIYFQGFQKKIAALALLSEKGKQGRRVGSQSPGCCAVPGQASTGCHVTGPMPSGVGTGGSFSGGNTAVWYCRANRAASSVQILPPLSFCRVISSSHFEGRFRHQLI